MSTKDKEFQAVVDFVKHHSALRVYYNQEDHEGVFGLNYSRYAHTYSRVERGRTDYRLVSNDKPFSIPVRALSGSILEQKEAEAGWNEKEAARLEGLVNKKKKRVAPKKEKEADRLRELRVERREKEKKKRWRRESEAILQVEREKWAQEEEEVYQNSLEAKIEEARIRRFKEEQEWLQKIKPSSNNNADKDSMSEEVKAVYRMLHKLGCKRV